MKLSIRLINQALLVVKVKTRKMEVVLATSNSGMRCVFCDT